MPVTERKTKWHRDWQEAFPIHTREVMLQQADGSTRYADVAAGNLIIEFQHSGISYEEIASRTVFHRAAGRDVWWVFDRWDKDISELIPREKTVSGDGHSLGSLAMSKRIIFAICPSNLNAREDRRCVGFPGWDGFGKILILDYGDCCVMLSGFNRLCCDHQYASVGYIFDHETVIQMALQYDEIISELGDEDWLVTFVENQKDDAAKFVLQACLDAGLIENSIVFYNQMAQCGSLNRTCYEIIASQRLKDNLHIRVTGR